MKNIYITLSIIIILSSVSLLIYTSMTKENQKNLLAKIETTEGNIEIELFLDKTPITAENFIKLAESKFYNNVKFHRVIKGFMIQAGDPFTKEDNVELYGRGGPGYTIRDEFREDLSNTVYTISMANTGMPNSGGSQFFINTRDNVELDNKHTVFGKVINGMEVIRKIENAETDEYDMPVEPIVILKIEIEK